MRGTRRTIQTTRRGFSLIENLMAAAVLGVIVLAVGLAVSSAQKASQEGQKIILGVMAADDLMSELSVFEYAALSGFELNQPVGAMATLGGQNYPETYWALGRSVIVEPATHQEAGLGISIEGQLVTVAAFDESRVVAELEMFIPEPAE